MGNKSKKVKGNDKKSFKNLPKQSSKENDAEEEVPTEVLGEPYVHPRFKRKVWAFVDTFTSFMAKNLILLSPYTVPDNLSLCIEKFHNELLKTFVFNKNKMVEINLLGLTNIIYNIIKDIPEFQALEIPKMELTSIDANQERLPDQDYISLSCLANTITVDFATREDADCWLAVNEKKDESAN